MVHIFYLYVLKQGIYYIVQNKAFAIALLLRLK